MKGVGSTRSLNSSGAINFRKGRKKRQSKFLDESVVDSKELTHIHQINLSESGIIGSVSSPAHNKPSETHSIQKSPVNNIPSESHSMQM